MSVRGIGSMVAVLVVAASCASGSDEAVTGTDIGADSTVAETTVASTIATADDAEQPSSSGSESFDGISFATASADPFDPVALTGLDDSGTDGLFALFELVDGATWGTPVLHGAEGTFVLAPPAPDDPYAGGTVEVRLTDGTDVGEFMSIDVSPLPDTDTTLEDIVERMRQSIDADARIADSSWDEIAAASMDDVRADLVPLKIAQMLVDDGTPNSVAGELADLDPDSADLAADMLAASGFSEPLGVDVLVEQIAEAQAALEAETSEVSGFASLRSSAAVPAVGAPSAAASLRQSDGCIPFDVEPNPSAVRLSEMMTNSALGAIASDSNTLANKYLSGAEMAMGLSASFEAAATGGKGKVAATFAKLIVGEKMRQAMNAGVLPSAFTSIDVTLDPTELEEDREEPGKWSEVMVTAVSTGYSLDADLAAIAIDKIGEGVVGKAGIDEGSLLEYEANAAVGEVKGAVTGMIPSDSGVVSFCPGSWEVDITGEDYSWARPLSGLLTVDNAAQTYVNEKEIGNETLAFSPWPPAFGGRTITGEFQVSTVAIDVTVTADPVEVTEPGEVVSITAEIDNAVVETLAWIPEQGEWQDGLMGDTNGPTTRPLKTPTDPDLYPFRVEVESTSRQGLRGIAGAERRYDFVEIELSPIVVTPDPGSVEVGKELTFTAQDREGNAVAVSWRGTGGEISSSGSNTGLYVAGDEPGMYEVTATLNSNSQVSKTVPVNVGERCLVGAWRMDQQRFADLLSGDGVSATPAGGSWDVTVAEDGSFVSTQSNFAFTLVAEGQTVRTTINGTETGSVEYTATDITSVTSSSRSLSFTGEVNGQTVTFSPDEVPLGTTLGGPYRCEDGRLIIISEGIEMYYDPIG